MLDKLLREMMRDQSRHRRGGRHRGYGRRRHRRTNVRVGGCCLPIPLGMLMFSGLLARAGFRKAHG